MENDPFIDRKVWQGFTLDEAFKGKSVVGRYNVAALVFDEDFQHDPENEAALMVKKFFDQVSAELWAVRN